MGSLSDGELHELTDMDTRKVDLVDRGANGVEFLVVKGAGMLSGIFKATKLGNYLMAQMESKDVTAAQMGRAAGISESTVGQILRGEIERPPDNRLQGFARALNVSFATIMNQLPENLRKQVGSDVAKQGIALPKDVKAALMPALTETRERLMAVEAAVNDAEETTEVTDTPVPESLVREMMAIEAKIEGLVAQYPSPVSAQGKARAANGDTMEKTEEMAKALGFESVKAAEEAAKDQADRAALLKRATDAEALVIETRGTAEEVAKAAAQAAKDATAEATKKDETAKGLATRLQALEGERSDEKKAALRKSLVADGKLPQSMHEYFDGLDLPAAEAFGKVAPVVQHGRTPSPPVGGPAGPAGRMSPIEKKYCSSLGVDPKEFVKIRDEMAAEDAEYAEMAKFQDTGHYQPAPAAPQEG